MRFDIHLGAPVCIVNVGAKNIFLVTFFVDFHDVAHQVPYALEFLCLHYGSAWIPSSCSAVPGVSALNDDVAVLQMWGDLLRILCRAAWRHWHES